MADDYENSIKKIFRPRLEKELEDTIAAIFVLTVTRVFPATMSFIALVMSAFVRSLTRREPRSGTI